LLKLFLRQTYLFLSLFFFPPLVAQRFKLGSEL
jgi:hypothetical protein